MESRGYLGFSICSSVAVQPVSDWETVWEESLRMWPHARKHQCKDQGGRPAWWGIQDKHLDEGPAGIPTVPADRDMVQEEQWEAGTM